jgi:hypothetical protein
MASQYRDLPVTGGGGSGVSTIANFGSTPNAAGGTISGSTLTLQPANYTSPGGVSMTTQYFAGIKNFRDGMTAMDTIFQVQTEGVWGVNPAPVTITANVGAAPVMFSTHSFQWLLDNFIPVSDALVFGNDGSLGHLATPGEFIELYWQINADGSGVFSGGGIIWDNAGGIASQLHSSGSTWSLNTDGTINLTGISSDTSGNFFINGLQASTINLASGNLYTDGFGGLTSLSFISSNTLSVGGFAGSAVSGIVGNGVDMTLQIIELDPTLNAICVGPDSTTYNVVMHSDGRAIFENTVTCTVGGFIPPQLADIDAAINSIYYSTDTSKLSYKDLGGTSHVLY